MDKRLEQKINEKILESLSSKNEIEMLAEKIGRGEKDRMFQFGIIVGRLYNSFYYQSRRILKREPTEEEFSEFLQMLDKRREEFLENI